MSNQDAIATAKAFIHEFNAQNHTALAGTLNYPHIRLANGHFVTIESAPDFADRSERNKKYLEQEGWHHSVLNAIEVIHGGQDKVHMALIVDRCHEDGTVYNTFETLWIATLVDDHWGIQFRSSFLR